MKRLLNHQLYLNDVIKIADVLDAGIHFLHISTDADSPHHRDSEMYKAIQQLLKDNSRYVLSEVADRDIARAIESYNEKHSIDLLVVIKKHHFYLSTLFHKSISEEVTLCSRIPVLIMREKYLP
jgi:nucleotide-binding universal stress UspA family protein